jgi:hypothetical protein
MVGSSSRRIPATYDCSTGRGRQRPGRRAAAPVFVGDHRRPDGAPGGGAAQNGRSAAAQLGGVDGRGFAAGARLRPAGAPAGQQGLENGPGPGGRRSERGTGSRARACRSRVHRRPLRCDDRTAGAVLRSGMGPHPGRASPGGRRPAEQRGVGLSPGAGRGRPFRAGVCSPWVKKTAGAGRAVRGPRMRGSRPRSASGAQGLVVWGRAGAALVPRWSSGWGLVAAVCLVEAGPGGASREVGRCPVCRPGLLVPGESACRVVPAGGCEQRLRSGHSAGYAARRRGCLVAYSAPNGEVTTSWPLSRRLRLRT